jgi:hypothetical protein
MRADECKCKFLASVAASELDFVLLNYIVFTSLLHFLRALDRHGSCYEIRSTQKNQSEATRFLLARFAGGIVHAAEFDIGGRRGGELHLRCRSSCIQSTHRGLSRLHRCTPHARATNAAA